MSTGFFSVSAQVDVRGDTYGMLAAHPVAPLVSLHHLDYVSPISPRAHDQLEALGSLVRASRLDPARTLQQSICYDPARNWSVSVAWGYSAQVYPRVLPPAELETPFQTFQTWRSYHNGPFTFNTRSIPPDPCDRPIFYFLAGVRGDDDARKKGRKEKAANAGKKVRGTVTEYSKYVPEKETAVCGRAEFVAASKVETVTVFSAKMDPDDWKKVSGVISLCVLPLMSLPPSRCVWEPLSRYGSLGSWKLPSDIRAFDPGRWTPLRVGFCDAVDLPLMSTV